MPGGHAVWTKFREIMVDTLFQFVIKDYAEVASARAFNLLRGFLEEPVQVRVVMSFAWFAETVIEGLVLAGDPGPE